MHKTLTDFEMPHEKQVHLAAETFRLLADPTRLKILWALLQGESNVACLAELTGAAPTAVSQHLAKLRMSRLVKGRREGTFVYYSAENDHVRRLLTQALYHADHIDRNAKTDTVDEQSSAGPGADAGDTAGSATGTNPRARRTASRHP